MADRPGAKRPAWIVAIGLTAICVYLAIDSLGLDDDDPDEPAATATATAGRGNATAPPRTLEHARKAALPWARALSLARAMDERLHARDSVPDETRRRAIEERLAELDRALEVLDAKGKALEGLPPGSWLEQHERRVAATRTARRIHERQLRAAD